jgi:peptide/nickel transport system substrate-binding protein
LFVYLFVVERGVMRMADENRGTGRYLNDELLGSTMTRRSVLRKGVIAGLSIPVASSILAACGEDEDEPEETDDEDVDDEEPAADPPDDEDEDDEVEEDEPDEEEPDEPDDDEEETDEPADSGDSESFFGDDFEEPQNQGGQIIEGAFADAETMNGILTQDTASSRVISMITKALIMNHPITTEPEPELAESWDISDDGIEYTFNLREDVTWHDGEQLTADDIVFTFETHLDEETGSPRTAQLSSRISSIEAVDEYTVLFTLNNPASPFLQQDMVNYIVPEHILGEVAPADLASHPYSTGEQGTTIGCGPFQFEEWVSGDYVTLVKYED